MKTFRTILCCALLGGFTATTLRAHTPPTDRQISQALANPELVNSLVQGASPQEAGQVLLRLLQRIAATDVAASQKNFLAAYYSARIAFLLGEDAAAMAESIFPNIPEELVPAVISGLSIGGRGSAVVMAALRELAGENAALLQAIDAPNIPLSDPVYNQLLVSLGAAQSLPPVVTDSLPPPIPVGDAPADPPPPVPRRYRGQS